MLMKSLDRLEETLDLETEALLVRDLSNLEEFNRRKSQSLLEISRLVRTVESAALDVKATKRLQELRAKIDRNQEILERHMRAVQEIANIVSSAIQHADSDGTYSANIQRVGIGA